MICIPLCVFDHLYLLYSTQPFCSEVPPFLRHMNSSAHCDSARIRSHLAANFAPKVLQMLLDVTWHAQIPSSQRFRLIHELMPATSSSSMQQLDLTSVHIGTGDRAQTVANLLTQCKSRHVGFEKASKPISGGRQADTLRKPCSARVFVLLTIWVPVA